MFHFVFKWAAGVVLVAISWCGATAADLSLALDSPQYEYVTREPVKLIVTLVNTSEETIRIPEIRFLGKNMEYMYYEITYPSGELMLRRFSYFDALTIPNLNYTGEALAPGQEIQVLLYPTVTFRISPEFTSVTEPTFTVPGEYQIRVWYFVTHPSEKLWRPPNDEGIASNAITLRFRGPDGIESDILDAIWAAGIYGPAMGDDRSWEFDERALERVVDAYPDHSLVRHAKLALARSYRGDILSEDQQRAAAIVLEELIRDYPDFRFEEVHLNLGLAHYRAGNRKEAIAVFRKALKQRPALRDSYIFMHRKLLITYETEEVLEVWKKSRHEGKTFNESEFQALD